MCFEQLFRVKYFLLNFFLVSILDGAFENGSVWRIAEEFSILLERVLDFGYGSIGERAENRMLGMKGLDDEFPWIRF